MCDHHEEKFRLNTPDFSKLNRQAGRRNFLTQTSMGIGALALGSLLGNRLFSNAPKPVVGNATGDMEQEILKAIPHFAPKAKRVVYLFMAGGPSQFETFDYKPVLEKLRGQNLPDSVRNGQRLTGMSSGQALLPVVPSAFKFNQHGESQTWISAVSYTHLTLPTTERV